MLYLHESLEYMMLELSSNVAILYAHDINRLNCSPVAHVHLVMVDRPLSNATEIPKHCPDR